MAIRKKPLLPPSRPSLAFCVAFASVIILRLTEPQWSARTLA
jgi:hypothetical protein